MAKPLSRNAQVLRFLLQVAPGIGRTKLLKLAYLADCAARVYLGRPVSTFTYRRYEQGPFDEAFYGACKELEAAGLLSQRQVEVWGYRGYEFQPLGGPIEFEFDLGESEVLRFIAEAYKDMTARDLCDDVVYETPPMKGAKMNEELPMDQLNRDQRDKLGFNLERLIQSEASVEAGRFRPLKDVMDELRARPDA